MGSYEPTVAIADAVAARLRIHGHIAVVDDRLPPNPADFSAVVIGCADVDGQIQALADYVATNRVGLDRVATALFVDGADTSHADELLDHICWRPDLMVAFGDAAEHGAMMRWVLHAVGRDGHATAGEIKRFADAVATGLARAASLGDLIRAPAC